MQLTAGTLVNPRVRLVRPLEEGGMGTVWVAEHLTLEHEVAVKFIASALATDNEQARQRFQREAKAAAQLRSPHVVQILDQGVMEDGTLYIVMELLTGNTLADWIDLTGRLGIAETASMVTQVARALSKAHQLGIVHRDIKPQNIFLVDEERAGEVTEQLVKVLDFGIARRGKISGGLTKPGVVIGTPEFICPDQVLDSEEPDAQTDLWSLSVVAYHALTGELPFSADTIAKLVGQLIRCEFSPPTKLRPELPQAVDAFFLRAFQRDSAKRFTSAARLATALREALEPASDTAPRSTDGGGVERLLDEDSSEVFIGTSPSTEIHLDELLHRERLADERGFDAISPGLLSLDEPGTSMPLTEPAEQAPSELHESPLAESLKVRQVEPAPSAPTTPADSPPAEPATQPWAEPAQSAPAQPVPAEPVEVSPAVSRRALIIAAVAAAGVLAGVVGVLLLYDDEGGDHPTPTPSSKPWHEPVSARVLVLAGDLTMGCDPDGGARCPRDQQPQHTVHLDAFHVDRTEVTVAQYRQCVDEDACSATHLTGSGKEAKDFDRLKCNWNEAGRGSHPVNCVSWDQAVAYCRWAGGTLPTEAQWERAARGDEARDCPGGIGRATCTEAVMKSDEGPGCGRGLTWQVGSRPSGASPFGALDMAGNVREWAQDWYQVQQYEDPTIQNPKGPAVGTERVVRGGGWLDESEALCATTRGHLPPDHRAVDLGFRCARSR